MEPEQARLRRVQRQAVAAHPLAPVRHHRHRVLFRLEDDHEVIREPDVGESEPDVRHPLTEHQDAALAEIRRELGLPQDPARMEAYDISNVQGTSAVGSMVVFENGKPKTAHYRRFRIKTVTGANDYAMLQEVLKRRFKRASEGTDTWAIMPDLVLIDGGRGQLNAALETLKESGVSVPAASLAKENEEIFLPDRDQPVVLPKTSPGLQMLQRLRDEAHRFAIGYFTRVHRQATFRSVLDGIPGIGPRRKKALLKQFGSPQAIKEAAVEAIAAAAGMSRAQAEKVKAQL